MPSTYDNMFNPYSSIWEVSGTTTPIWTWQGMDSEVNGEKVRTIGFSTVTNDSGGESTSDIKTDKVTAPFSQFSRWLMLDYSGINGVIYSGDHQLIDRYFDIGLARANQMWTSGNPTYSDIIKRFQDIDAGRYRIQDFLYNKYFMRIPINYLITLRRYPMACTDEPFTLAYPEDTHKEIHNRGVLLPISTATTYMSEIAGNKMEDILKFAFGLNFSEKTSELQSINSGTPGATGFGFGQKWHNAVMAGGHGNTDLGTAFVGGFAASGVNFLASTRLTPAKMEIAAQAAQVDPWAKYSKYTNGPVDVIMKTKIREQGLNFTNDFNLKFEYVLKSLQYVNPKIAMLDIIGNMLSMATNTGTFWGGATRYYGNGGGYGKQPGDLDAFARGDYADKVMLTIKFDSSRLERIKSDLTNLSGGKFVFGEPEECSFIG